MRRSIGWPVCWSVAKPEIYRTPSLRFAYEDMVWRNHKPPFKHWRGKLTNV